MDADDRTAGAPASSRGAQLWAGVRAGVPFTIAGALLAMSFGIVAQGAGLSGTAAIVMSVVMPGGMSVST